MDPSWSASQFSFLGFQQTPNAFSQMSQCNPCKKCNPCNKANAKPIQLTISIPTTTFTATVESSPQPQPVEGEVEECVPETQPQSPKRKKGKKVARLNGDQPSRAKLQPWSKIEDEALAKAWISTSKSPIVGVYIYIYIYILY
ncbi:hypothetical protein Hanom_Chr16g01440541 [Helianthus anomalus]